MSINLDVIKSVVAQFFDEVRQAQWESAALLTQQSWQKMVTARTPAERVEALFGDRGIDGFEVGEAIRVSGVMYDVVVDLTFGGATEERRFVLRVICETGPYEASRDGTWGVNPNSMRAQR